MEHKKSEFNEWYNEVIDESGLVDKRYPVKGMNVWLPYGWAIARNIDNIIRDLMFSNSHEEVYFPLLVPKDQFAKEEEHIKGFGGEVFWVDRGGETPLDIPLVLRPTSETAMYPLFSLWIRNHADLPLKIFQIVNVFRYETKQTRAFIRVREIHFFEAHTCHDSFEDAEKQINEDKEIWEKFCEKMALPYILNVRPEWDKFAGAYYSIAADTIMPSGRPLQIGTMHQYRQNFAKAYNIMFTKEDGSRDYVHQTTFGISERIIGAIVGIHGDDRGLILPPEIAPYQIVIVPIVTDEKEIIIKESRKLFNELSKFFRVKLDERENYTPGYKFYDWELKGVPLRVEIGPKDLKNNVITVSRRDTLKRSTIKRENFIEKIEELLKEIQINLRKIAKENMTSLIKDSKNLDDVKNNENVDRIFWCGSTECAEKMEEYTGKRILGTPLNGEETEGKCIVCGKNTKNICFVGRSY
ncbi:MAG: proline--tRNA ligase [Thermoplasmata archaeon]